MRHAIIENGVVVNVIEWDGQSEWSPPDGTQAVQSDAAQIGWPYRDGQFISPPPPPAPSPVVPQVLPWWKGRAIIALDGRTSMIEGFIASLSEPAKTVTQLAWEGADFVRTSPTVIAALDVAGYTTDAAKDDLFVRGAAITR